MMFSSRARALSEMGIAVWAMKNDPWAIEPLQFNDAMALGVISQALMLGTPVHMDALEKWLKESAEGRGAFIKQEQ